MEVLSQHSRHSRNKTFEEYSNSQELISDVEAMKHDNFILSQTTEVFERYLKKRSPASLAGVDKFVEQSGNVRSTLLSTFTPRSSLSTSLSGASPSSTTSPSHSRHCRPSHSLAHSAVAAYRISPLFKIDMIDRELDESKIAMDKLKKRFDSAIFLLGTEEENIRSDIILVGKTKTALENFIKQAIDKKTGRVFHDKFFRFTENELQNTDRDLRKLRLKTKSIQIEYNRLLSRQEQRLELRERLHPVDLDKLFIENEELQEKFEHKTMKIMDLKKTVGKKGQQLVSVKSKLNDVLLALRNIKQELKQKESKYNFTENKEIKNVNELITAEIIHRNMKKLHSTFKSPNAHDYLMVEVKLNELKTEKEVWDRRSKYQRQTIALLEHQLKQLSPPKRNKPKGSSTHSYRTSRSVYSSKSADSILRHFTHTPLPIPHCTPTSPTFRKWTHHSPPLSLCK